MKVLIGQSLQTINDFANRGGLGMKDFIAITPLDWHKLKGLELAKEDLIVVGEPLMPYQFWQELQTRIRLTGGR